MAGERVTLSVEIKSRQGQVFTVPVENVKWQVDDEVPGWAAGAAAGVSETGLMRGDPGGRFRSLDTVTGAEAVTVINSWHRLLYWK